MFPTAPISKPSLALSTYTLEPIPVIGEVSVQVQHNGYTGTHQLVVVGGKGPALLGRDWLKRIRLDWASIQNVVSERSLLTSEQITTEYTELFQSEAGALKHFKANLSLKEGARPRFCRPCTALSLSRNRQGRNSTVWRNRGYYAK